MDKEVGSVQSGEVSGLLGESVKDNPIIIAVLPDETLGGVYSNDMFPKQRHSLGRRRAA
jgi:hypothetical protein